MLTFDNAVAAANAFSDYVIVEYGAIPERLRPFALAASRERSPVTSIVKGMEVAYAILFEQEAPSEARAATVAVLGTLTHQVYEHDFWSKSDRALLMQRIVKAELGELPPEASPPEWPAVDPEYAVPADVEPPTEPEAG